jgi:hypothetical protein
MNTLGMHSAYKYLYYRIYSWNRRTWGESDVPHFNALLGVSFLLCLNLISCLTAVEVLTGRRVVLSRLTVVVSGLTVLLASYFLLVHKRRYREIAREFSNETSIQRRRRLVAAIIYVTLSFLSFFWLVRVRNS